MAEHTDPSGRLERLIAGVEPRLRRRFLEVIAIVRDDLDLDALEGLLAAGRVDDALSVLDRAMARFASSVNVEFLAAGRDTAEFLGGLGVVVDFDQANLRAVGRMQESRLRLIREFSLQQREATRDALTDGIRRGLNPRDQARLFRSTVGLTARQERTVQRYRALLDAGDTDALRRELRDKRFDRTVRRAAVNREPLSTEQVDRMVNRYRERMVASRSRTIARTEALRSVHEGSEEAYQQAYDSGALDPDSVTRTWVTARDEAVRGSHSTMNGQQQPPGQPFISGNGYALQFPGDPAAPAAETIQCRCSLATRLDL